MGELENFATVAEVHEWARDRCPECNVSGAFVETPHLEHYGKIACPQCSRWMRWVPWPKQQQRRRDLKGARKAIAAAQWCEICLRTVDQLPMGRQRLEAHHIWPVAAGGSNDADNLQAVCPDCHDWIEQRRREFARSRRQE